VKDIFNYECMETFGDSFLKFATSLLLFDTCSLHDEGALTIIRTKIVGNQHLCRVGRISNIVSYMVFKGLKLKYLYKKIIILIQF